MSDFDWYYDLKPGEEPNDLSEVNDVSTMYEKLAEKLASQMYRKVYDEIYAFSREAESYHYGDNPTIWEQLKSDVEHGEFLNKDRLIGKCNEHLENYKLTEIWLIWVYACEHAKHHNVYDELPDSIDCINDITDIILADLYRAAEEEVRTQ